ncbi:MAG TPA: hypothetical protein ENK60_05290 [Anaerolineae bacterium]|nr:hypothetical protein [Anaerolineae bacterium]
MKRISLALFVLALAALALTACGSTGPILANARIEPDVISPNADGVADVARIAYTIRRPGTISIYFEDDAGHRYYFRKDQHRGARDYNVLWGGVIEKPIYLDPDRTIEAYIGQVLPDGRYRWVIEATDARGFTDRAEGVITIRDADTEMPEFENFAVNPEVITPNQDGIDDRASITYWLTKDVEEVQVYLMNPRDPENADRKYPRKYPLEPTEREVEPTEAGYHFYDYDGGIDKGADPPPDGDYLVVAEAWDKVGNHNIVTGTLTIKDGGYPRAQIVEGKITMVGPLDSGYKLNIPLGGKLIFTATIENYGRVPIRTAGPWPGTVYKASENYNTLAYRENEPSWFEQSGTWRFGLNYQSNFGQDWPFRYAVGRKAEDLRCELIDGREQCFLDPGERGLVYGTIIWDIIPPRNPFRIWGGLLHEDVRIENNFADVHEIEIADPNQAP